jgi:hypothetical protein
MNKVLFSCLGCSGAIVSVMTTGTLANPDTNQTIPFPEVMNLSKVPRFDAQGLVRSTDITSNNLPDRVDRRTVVTKAQPAKIIKETIATAINQPTLKIPKTAAHTQQFRPQVGERMFAPTNVMVLGYSMPNGKTSVYPQPIAY